MKKLVNKKLKRGTVQWTSKEGKNAAIRTPVDRLTQLICIWTNTKDIAGQSAIRTLELVYFSL